MIHVGIIGCGSIARQRHAYEYAHNPDAKIAGFYDLSTERAQELAAQYACKAYQSVEDMLSDPQVDAVSVCVANAYHARYTIAALNAGKHVLCEKPMAITWEDCEAMHAAAIKNGKRLMIGQNQRLSPAHKKAHQLLASGEMGRVLSFSTTFGHRGPESWCVDKSAATWFFRKDMAAIGSMADLGIHKIDLMCYLLNDKVRSVYAKLATLDKKLPDGSPIEVDDNSIELLSFEKGTLGTVTTSWTHYGAENNATVLYCEKGIMHLYDDPDYSLDIDYRDGTRTRYVLDRMQTNEDAQQTSSGTIDTFIGGLISGQPTVLDSKGILESMKVVFACLRSAETGAAVEL